MYIITGPVFGETEGINLVVFKILYSICSSGSIWYVTLLDTLRIMRLIPCKVEPEIWIREKYEIWKYITVYVEGLEFVTRYPELFIKRWEKSSSIN